MILTTLLIALAINALFFLFAVTLKTDKVTDLSYGLSFLTIALSLLVVEQTAYHFLLVLAITLWSIRLATYLFFRIIKMGKDRRFDKIRNNPVEFGKFWLFQAVAVWLIMLPATVAFSTIVEVTLLSDIALLIAFLGLLIETIADWQKYAFKANIQNSGKWTDTGLWKYSRHPNYFGELLFWWGIYLYCLPALAGWQHLAIIGPLTITCLLLFITGIPPLEQHNDDRYDGDPRYKKYKKHTRLLVPWPK